MTSSSPASLRQRLRYSFENTLSKGSIAIIGWLGLLSLLIVILAAAIIYFGHIPSISGEESEQWGFVEAAWKSLMRTFDAGNMADDGGWPLRAVTLLVTLGGIFIVATLIGTITSGLEGAIEEMRKGRSRVLEHSHTLILGWSPKIFTIISELLIANANQRRPRIVILADRDKVEMEDEIKSKFPDTGRTRIICRTGSPLDLIDLEVASPHDAKSIIVLSPEEVTSPDTYVIKSILALTNNPNRKAAPYHIVAELQDEKNIEAGRLVGGDEVSLVLSADMIARVTAQTCRQSGLSVVYTELLDFAGAEIYLRPEPGLRGRTYREALSMYDSSAVMGLQRAQNGPVLLNPPMDTRFEEGDSVIAITEDDDTLILGNSTPVAGDKAAIQLRQPTPSGPERTLILGWNAKATAVIRELDNYVAGGSEIVVVSEGDGVAEDVATLQSSVQRLTLSFQSAPITERAVLESLQVPTFDHIIVLCYDHLEVQEADAQVLVSLLHLRSIAERTGSDFEIVSEMRDVRNRALAEVAKADDFIVSDKLISLLLSQISENKALQQVFAIIFSAEGSEIYLRPAQDYVQLGVPMNFYSVVEAASRRGETALGYRLQSLAGSPEEAYGVVVNPTKSAQVTFAAGDRVIVLAEA